MKGVGVLRRLTVLVAALALGMAGTASGHWRRYHQPVKIRLLSRHPGRAPFQRLTIVNEANVPHKAIVGAERAVRKQINHEVHRDWRTPRVVFAGGGWPIYITTPAAVHAFRPGDDGFHSVRDGAPWMMVAWGPSDVLSIVLSHEVIETLVDPWLARSLNGHQVEPCDVVWGNSYDNNDTGVPVSDYALPSWYTPGSRGPWSEMRTTHAALMP